MAGQLGHLAVEGTPTDDKVWIKNSAGGHIYRLDLASDKFEDVGVPKDPRTGKMPYAVVQLRQENLRADSYNLVGFQNHLKFGEQARVLVAEHQVALRHQTPVRSTACISSEIPNFDRKSLTACRHGSRAL